MTSSWPRSSPQDRTLGVLALRLGRARAPDPEELRLLQTLGQQAGLALERARLYDQQRSVATTLQHSMLPGRLPDDPRLGLSACYRPAVDVLEVGGDWYDAFFLDADRVAVVVGDVVGRGLHAAAVMGQLRSAVRALATVDSGPASCSPGWTGSSRACRPPTRPRWPTPRWTCATAASGTPAPVTCRPSGGPRRPGCRCSGTAGPPRSAPTSARPPGRRRAPRSRTAPASCSTPTAWSSAATSRSTSASTPWRRSCGRWAHRPFETLADGVTDTVLGPERIDDDVCLLALAYRASGSANRPR